MKVAVEGFGQSFLAWNLAGCVRGAWIYADRDAPYRLWNRVIPVAERWLDIPIEAPVVFLDHAEPEVAPDVLILSAAPDPLSVCSVRSRLERARGKTVWVMNGYEREVGKPWPFGEREVPLATIPWDERNATSYLMGKPLTMRDPSFRRHWMPILEVLSLVDLV